MNNNNNKNIIQVKIPDALYITEYFFQILGIHIQNCNDSKLQELFNSTFSRINELIKECLKGSEDYEYTNTYFICEYEKE